MTNPFAQQGKCPICLGRYLDCAMINRSTEEWIVDCEVCGRYRVRSEVAEDYLAEGMGKLTPVQRSALSHLVRRYEVERKQGREPMFFNHGWYERVSAEELKLPSPALQAINLIRWIGDQLARTGEPVSEAPSYLYAEVGAPNPQQLAKLSEQLVDQQLLFGIVSRTLSNSVSIKQIDLTLAGWNRYEDERRGRLAANYGFVAMKFGEHDLETLLREHVAPAIESSLAYKLVDMRAAASVGIIDNIMREKIRDAAFVLVDLTHDNPGAYWEAGYAEGLGKPVLYICEDSKFKRNGTHFDTNHLTTVMWDVARPEAFVEELLATLKRSLHRTSH
jgi:nucleoside 2-deoxyribosyltransferase